ncbi:MAG: hypothetical protein IPJ74_09725 [Saprospiraceae bacterium]|nr:hypothetical protein [Saprospiraceae bacterium]
MFYIILLSWSANQVKAQSLTYHIFIGKKQAGTLKANMDKLSNGLFTLRLESSTAFTLVKIYTLMEAEYRNGQLWSASNMQKVNGKIKTITQTKRAGEEYRITADGEENLLKKNIIFSVSMLYHIEPEGISSVFSERFGEFCKIRKTSEHHYELEMPDGKITRYIYKNGICTEMQSDHTMANIRLILQTVSK